MYYDAENFARCPLACARVRQRAPREFARARQRAPRAFCCSQTGLKRTPSCSERPNRILLPILYSLTGPSPSSTSSVRAVSHPIYPKASQHSLPPSLAARPHDMTSIEACYAPALSVPLPLALSLALLSSQWVAKYYEN